MWVDPLARYEGHVEGLTVEEERKAREVFSVYGPQVERSQVAALLRAMGLTPSFLDMRELNKDLHRSSDSSLSFQSFLELYAAQKKPWDSMDEVMLQLSSFDHNGDGTIDSNEMVSALTTLGDTMTDAQCQRLVALADDRGRISIAVLAKWLLSK